MSYIRIREGLRLRQGFGSSFGESGGSYIRVGENLYAAGDQSLLTSYVDNPIFESAEDIVYESSPSDLLEEIPLDTIEISTELSPLLTTAATATTSAVTSAALPGTTAIISGITIAGVAIGTGLGIGLTVPGRPNTGPGNEEETPTSNSDRVSADHDSAYSNAKTQEDVRQADDIFLHEQFNELTEGDTINAAIGIAGIGTKRVIESAIGVQYPPNLPTTPSPGKPLL
uniref:ORF1 n=1 Tax=uncultured densovirus TaxID=748192 RepID=A0A7L7YTR9_9VIRU|nr:ORF1 [uncultured densovirus]